MRSLFSDEKSKRAFGNLGADEFFTGAQGNFSVASYVRLYTQGGMIITPTRDLIVPKDAYYLVLVRAYISNVNAGTTGYILATLDGSGIVAARIHVSGAGGTDETSVHIPWAMKKGQRLNMQRAHNDGGASRQMAADLTVVEL